MAYTSEQIKSCYHIKDNSFFIAVLIQPNSPKSIIQGLHDGKLKIRIHSPPVDGKANEELIRFLAKFFAVKKNQVEILRGHTDKNKHIQITTHDLLTLEKKLMEALNLIE